MNDPKQDRLVRFMEKHQVSAHCGARLVAMRLGAKWNLPAPDVVAIVDPEAIDWYALNPPLDASHHIFPNPQRS